MNLFLKRIVLVPVLVMITSFVGYGQHKIVDSLAVLYSNTQVLPNIVYKKIDTKELLLDLYVPCKRLGEPPWIEYSVARKPTLLFFHGGGWTAGDKISRSLLLMPYINRGWCVISANYRLLNETSLIGMIGDARSALNWIYENADKYRFDTTKIIVSGESSGSHLALMTGFLNGDSLYQQGNAKRTRLLKVAGIINWFGSSDLVQASKNWTPALYKLAVGNGEYADSIFRVTSPINFITSASPPVITIHGDQDKTALYSQALLLHNQLNKTGVKNYLLTIVGKKHGNFDGFEMTQALNEIWNFLQEIGIK